MALDADRQTEGLYDPVGAAHGDAGLGGAVEKHEELVGTRAGDDVGLSDRGAEAVGHSPKDAVAGGIAKRVVHCLEVIDVDGEQREAAAFRGVDGAPPFDLPCQRRAIVQTSEAVAKGEML